MYTLSKNIRHRRWPPNKTQPIIQDVQDILSLKTVFLKSFDNTGIIPGL